jgi:hypothetical protein
VLFIESPFLALGFTASGRAPSNASAN